MSISAELTNQPLQDRRELFGYVRTVFNKSAALQIPVLILIVFTILLLVVPHLAPYSAIVPSGDAFLAPSSHHLMGTDQVGRDVFSRLLHGIRASWLSALAVVALSLVIGAAVGAVAGARGGFVDSALMRATDVFLSLPAPVLAIAIAAAMGSSLTHSLLAITIVWWPLYARLARADVRLLIGLPHYEAARVVGVSSSLLIVRHLMPGAVPRLLVAATLDLSNVVLVLASLSFLGLGAPAPAPELGAMSAQGLGWILQYWWVPVMPGLGVFALALIANICGDAMRVARR